MSIVFPTNTKDIIDDIRTAIGRNVTFYSENKSKCSSCDLDPVTDTSTNSFCPVCSGVGYLYTYSGMDILAHVTWSPSDIMQWSQGGQYFEGDCRVSVEYTVGNLATVEASKYVVIDTKRLKVLKKMFRGVKDINRILIDLKEE